MARAVAAVSHFLPACAVTTDDRGRTARGSGCYRGEPVAAEITVIHNKTESRFETTVSLPRGVPGLQVCLEGKGSGNPYDVPLGAFATGDARFDETWVMHGAPEGAVRSLLSPDAREYVERLGRYVCPVAERVPPGSFSASWQHDPLRLEVGQEGVRLLLRHAVYDPSLYVYIVDGLMALLQGASVAMQHALQQPGGAERCAAELRGYQERLRRVSRRRMWVMLVVLGIILLPLAAFFAWGIARILD